MADKKTRIDFVRHVYDREAHYYDLTRRFTLTNRNDALSKLNLSEGQTVLDIGCGTGENFPYIYEKIGREGKIIGIDISTNMLNIARRKIEYTGYENIKLYETDATLFVPNVEFDAVIFGDVLFAIDNYRKAIENAVRKLKIGGRAVILDFKLTSGCLKGINYIWRKWSNLFGGDFGRTPWKDLEELVGKVTLEEYWFGLRYIAYATKRENE